MDPQEMARREHEALVAAFAALARVAEDGWVERYGGVVATVSGSPLGFFNRLYAADEATVTDMEEAAAAIQQSGLAWTVSLRKGEDDHLESALAESGLKSPSRLTPGMAIRDLEESPLDTPLEIRHGAGVIADHCAVASVAFGIPLEMLARLLRPGLIDHGFEYYTGYLGGEPVTASVGFFHEGATTVFNVATLPGHQGAGHGSTMTLVAMQAGLALGCNAAFLQSTEAGYRVYRRLGFETVVEYRVWESPGQ